MTNEALKELVRSPAIAKQLLSKLTKLDEGIQSVEVQTTGGRMRKLRAVRLERHGDALRLSRKSS